MAWHHVFIVVLVILLNILYNLCDVKDFNCHDEFYRDGKEYEAQHVMVTPAIGYLQKNLSLFSPPLPKSLQQVSGRIRQVV